MAKREQDITALVTIGLKEARDMMGVGRRRFEKLWNRGLKHDVPNVATGKGCRILLPYQLTYWRELGIPM